MKIGSSKNSFDRIISNVIYFANVPNEEKFRLLQFKEFFREDYFIFGNY